MSTTTATTAKTETTACELWQCPHCGVRAINGKDRYWHSPVDGEKCHLGCELTPGTARLPAVLVPLSDEQRLLLDLVRGVRIWKTHAGGIHMDVWPPYMNACAALGLPTHKAE